ncbi:MAG: VanZ family protein [Desulfocapsaceae bacterium]|nr:VanZ family protein [Desulfocapsaceae bacterium]
MSLWLAFYLCLFQPYWHGVTSKLVRIFLGLTVVVLVVGVTLPGWVKNDLRRDAIREIKSCIVPVEHMVVGMHVVDVPSFKMLKVDITHLAHFLLFSFLALLLILGNPKSSVSLVLTYLALIACSTELMQFYIEERSPLVQDFMIDMAGGGMVVLGWYLIGSSKGIERADV